LTWKAIRNVPPRGASAASAGRSSVAAPATAANADVDQRRTATVITPRAVPYKRAATIEGVAEQPQQPLEQQLEEIGAQLAWVRDYL